ncbi:hypothetical protein BU26DRAFT_488328 [Trematosphaeria pertusa]|uniref:BTB domain-containing protein n=1 Tax=Trematosphaeria pertusa TaxID=390896 RepID=A0A6A6IBQ4_9PLEO|nr:uncharacterized protein BU26DRAFT_488328 [Trematosphaeria pertusa]KAF2246923.1 hypothetical protein BU26DRAFT_488328 [Trematosphaeria pertusa]
MTILVEQGGRKKKFQMHRGLLCHYSEYFNTLLNGGFGESGRNFHKLTEVEIDTFQVFFYWLNTGVISDGGGQDLQKVEIIKVYVFADCYLVQELKNKILEALFLSDVKTWAVSSFINPLIYDQTPEGSPLRKLHVDLTLETEDFKDWREHLEHYPKEYLADLFDACRERKVVPGSAFGLDNGGTEGWIKEKMAHFCERYHDHTKPEARGSVGNV